MCALFLFFNQGHHVYGVIQVVCSHLMHAAPAEKDDPVKSPWEKEVALAVQTDCYSESVVKKHWRRVNSSGSNLSHAPRNLACRFGEQMLVRNPRYPDLILQHENLGRILVHQAYQHWNMRQLLHYTLLWCLMNLYLFHQMKAPEHMARTH